MNQDQIPLSLRNGVIEAATLVTELLYARLDIDKYLADRRAEMADLENRITRREIEGDAAATVMARLMKDMRVVTQEEFTAALKERFLRLAEIRNTSGVFPTAGTTIIIGGATPPTTNQHFACEVRNVTKATEFPNAERTGVHDHLTLFPSGIIFRRQQSPLGEIITPPSVHRYEGCPEYDEGRPGTIPVSAAREKLQFLPRAAILPQSLNAKYREVSVPYLNDLTSAAITCTTQRFDRSLKENWIRVPKKKGEYLRKPIPVFKLIRPMVVLDKEGKYPVDVHDTGTVLWGDKVLSPLMLARLVHDQVFSSLGPV